MDAVSDTDFAVDSVTFRGKPGGRILLDATVGGLHDGSYLFFVQDGKVNGGYSGVLSNPIYLDARRGPPRRPRRENSRRRPFLPKGAPDLVVEEGPSGAFHLRYWVYGGTPRICPPGRCIWPKDGLERPGGPTEPHGAKVSVDARTGVATFGEYGRIYLAGPP